MTIEEARKHIGDGVVYTPPRLTKPITRVSVDRPYEGYTEWVLETDGAPPREDGIITSVNDVYVFVRYRGDAGSKATRPEDLELLVPDGS